MSGTDKNSAKVKSLRAAIVCAATLVVITAPQAFAQSSGPLPADHPYVIERMDGTITLDGWSDEPAWKAIEPLPMTMYLPSWGSAPTERSEIRLAYDDEYVYVSGRLYYTDPNAIRATTRKRDNGSTVNDMLAVTFDSFDDNETALSFMTTPAGTRSDVSFTNDSEGPPSRFFKSSWNTFWRTESVTDERGWFVEMRIPFSSLSFEEGVDGRTQMGLIAWRWIAHKQEAQVYPAIPNKWGWWGQFKPSQAQTVVFADIESRQPVYITPYLLGGLGQHFALNPAGTAYEREDEPAYDVGLDVKYRLTNNFTLDLTANTDFAQVEADNQQINLTRFSLFFPEKRRFFLERAGIFDFAVTPAHRLFYSRRIGLFSGQPISILGGARLVGRKGPWDVGVLNMQTSRTSLDATDVLPSENFSVVRLRRRVINPYSYVGGMTTSRIGMDGTYNLAYGLDTQVRLFHNEYARFDLAQTFDSERSGGFDAIRLNAAWERRSANGLGYEATITRSGADYDPGVGFELRDNYTRFGGNVSHGRLASSSSPILRRTAGLDGELILRNEDGTVETAAVTPSWEYMFRSEKVVRLDAAVLYEDLRQEFVLSTDVSIPPGSYTFYQLDGMYDMTDSRLFDTDVSLRAGTFYDGYIASIGVTPIWSISPGLKLSGYYEFNYIRFPDRGERFNTHLARLRLLVMPSTDITISPLIQYNGAADHLSINARLRYNPREGNDFYLVYNEGLNTERSVQTPALPFTSGRTVMAKYTYTFAF